MQIIQQIVFIYVAYLIKIYGLKNSYPSPNLLGIRLEKFTKFDRK